MSIPTEPALQHLRLDAGGLDVHVVAAGPMAGRLVILLHGFPEFWIGWRETIGPLAAAGFRILAPDQRGYNLTEKPTGIEAYGLDRLAADVVGMADAIGVETFDVVGHDWGGIVAWWAALKYPERVRRLVAVNAPHPVAARRYARRHWRQFMRSWYIVFFRIPRLPEWLLARRNFALLIAALTHSAPTGLFTPADCRAYREAWARPGALTAMLAWYRAFWRFRARNVDLIVRQPTLILWGDRDRYLESGLAEASLRHCAAGRLVRVAGASHWLQRERADLVAAEITAFLGAG